MFIRVLILYQKQQILWLSKNIFVCSEEKKYQKKTHRYSKSQLSIECKLNKQDIATDIITHSSIRSIKPIPGVVLAFVFFLLFLFRLLYFRNKTNQCSNNHMFSHIHSISKFIFISIMLHFVSTRPKFQTHTTKIWYKTDLLTTLPAIL